VSVQLPTAKVLSSKHFENRVAERTVELKVAIAESEALRSRLLQENQALKE
jgi:hypothetical protein